MLITEGENGSLIFSWYERPNRKKSATLAEDHATRRRINRVFRRCTAENVLQKALRRLRALEHGGDYLPGGYEYAVVLDSYVSEVVNSRF